MTSVNRRPSRAQLVRAAAVVIGVVLTAIGIRFWLAPDSAARDFGVGRGAYRAALHDVIAVRDAWLGLLAIALGLLKEWRALALWFGLGAGVCIVDAGIAVAAGGGALSIAFHIGSGIVMALMAGAALPLSERRRRG